MSGQTRGFLSLIELCCVEVNESDNLSRVDNDIMMSLQLYNKCFCAFGIHHKTTTYPGVLRTFLRNQSNRSCLPQNGDQSTFLPDVSRRGWIFEKNDCDCHMTNKLQSACYSNNEGSRAEGHYTFLHSRMKRTK